MCERLLPSRRGGGGITAMNLGITYVEAGRLPLIIYSFASETDMLWAEQKAVRRLRSRWPYVHHFSALQKKKNSVVQPYSRTMSCYLENNLRQ